MRPGFFCLLALTGLVYSVSAEEIKVSTILQNGFTDQKGKNLTGFYPDLVKAICDKIGVTCKLQLVKDGMYGKLNPDGTSWTGMVGELQNGDVQMVAAPLTITDKRESVVDFSDPIITNGVVMVGKAPTKTEEELESGSQKKKIIDALLFIFKPLGLYVWISAVSVWLVTTVLIFINSNFNPREFKTFKDLPGGIKGSNAYTFMGAIFFTASTGCFQGYKKAPNSVAGRLLAISWWAFMGLFGAVYLAGLICTIISYSQPIGAVPSASMLAMQSIDEGSFDYNIDFIPLWLPSGSTATFMQNSSDPRAKFLWKKYQKIQKSKPDLLKANTLSEIFDKIKQDDRVVGILEESSVNYEMNRNDSFVSYGQPMKIVSYGLAFQKDSTYKDKVNKQIAELKKSGFIDGLYAKFIGPKVDADDMPDFYSAQARDLLKVFDNAIPIEIDQFCGPVALFLLGLVLSGIGVLVDICLYVKMDKENLPEKKTRAEESDESNLAENVKLQDD